MLTILCVVVVWFGLGLLSYGALKGYSIYRWKILAFDDESFFRMTILFGPFAFVATMFTTEFFIGGFIWRTPKYDYSRKSTSNY